MRLPRSFYLLGATTLVVALFWGGSQPFAVGLFPVPYDKLAHSLYFATLSLLLWFGTAGEVAGTAVCRRVCDRRTGRAPSGYLAGTVADVFDYLIDTVAAGIVISLLVKNKMALGSLQRRKEYGLIGQRGRRFDSWLTVLALVPAPGGRDNLAQVSVLGNPPQRFSCLGRGRHQHGGVAWSSRDRRKY